MKHFDSHGNLTFGKHRGTHHSKLPPSWKDWACANVRGFQEELGKTKAQPTPTRQRPTGRFYKLDYNKKHVVKMEGPPPGGGPDPDDAVDWEDDPGMGQYFEQG